MCSSDLGRLDPREIDRGLEGQGPLAPHGGVRLAGEQALDLGPFDPATAGDYSENRSRFFAFLRAARVLRFRLTLGFS